ncbi:uncharacterized protein LOC122505231 [Leptopilina heterotoma]|uniref:uncharacterized protein LOC122505231 n=1 Tax=Leptopilina heterotoma TaxID=63436 RepID=UPI001CA7C584|nr:uncharacterized protein LOC122505231 [Leptopilina heterotoma]
MENKAINVLKLEKEIFTNSLIFDPNVKETFLFLISIPKNSVIDNKQYTTTAILQEDPKLSCDIKFFKVSNTTFEGEITCSGQTLNQEFAVTFYRLNSECSIGITKTIDLPPVSHECTHFFTNSLQPSKKMKVSDTQTHFLYIRKSSIAVCDDSNDNVYVYCKIVVKDVLPVKLDVLKRTIPSKFVSLYKDNMYSDFKIISKNEEFSVHKAILAQSSSVFRAMFENQMKESLESKVEINNFEPTVVKQMIHFMYSDEIENDSSQESLKQLYMAAHMYQLEDLKKLCLNEICKSVKDISEVVDVIFFLGSEFREEIVEFLKSIRYTLLLKD